MKTWKKTDIYNFSVEFNRIEGYNKYCQEQLEILGISVDFINKTDWNENDIVDMNDLNRVKKNINLLLEAIDLSVSRLNISTQINQNWNSEKANELETRLESVLSVITNWQFMFDITGLKILGNEMKLGGVD